MSKIFFFALIVVVGCTSRSETPLKFEAITTPAISPSAEPFLFTASDETVYLSWIEKQNDRSDFKFSKLINNEWSAPTLIDSGRTWFVNWADYPMIAANEKTLLAHYLDKSGDGTFSYDIKFTTSPDEGKTWTPAAILHDDGKQAEHGFVCCCLMAKIFVTWLDGRNTVMEGMEDHHGHHGQMSLRAAVLDKAGKKLNEWELDNRTCDCCQTSAAITSNGPVVVYRDRSDDEIRDMSIVRYVSGEWTQPKPVHSDKWKIAGCPVNGPRVVSQGNKLAVVWFSKPNEISQVNVAFSDDGGETFSLPIRVDEGGPIGRVDITWLNEENTFVTWMEGTAIKGARVNDREKIHRSQLQIRQNPGPADFLN